MKVIERSDDIREEGASINIGTNGWKAMHALGVADALRAKFVTIERCQRTSYRYQSKYWAF